MTKKIVIMAGGTGGHVYPGLAVAKVLQDLGWAVEWFGTATKMEADVVPKAGYPIHFLSVKGVRGKGIVGKLTMPFMLVKAVLDAKNILKAIKPDVVLGMGGYASGPGGIAAKLLGIPIVIHEQNAIFGLTNRFLSKVTTHVLCGFDVLSSRFSATAPSHTQFVGNPVRQSFFDSNEQDNDKDSVNILVLGGSLGALALNQIVPPVLNSVSKQHALKIRHQAGKGKADLVNELYKGHQHALVTEFIDDMASALHLADIVICRAGALTVAEIATVGRTAIFVPLPIAVDDHQTYNAKSLSEEGAGILISQDRLEQELPMHLKKLLDEPALIDSIGTKARQFALPNAAAAVAQVCVEAASNKHD